MSDVIVTVWVLTIFGVLFLWLPATRLFSEGGRFTVRHVARSFARMMLVTAIAAWALSRLQLLNALTLTAVYASWAVALWSVRHRRKPATVVRDKMRRMACRAAALWEDERRSELGTTAAKHVRARVATGITHGWGMLPRTPTMIVTALLVSIAGAATLMLRFIWPLAQLRLGHPEGYQALLATHAILAGQTGTVGTPAFPAVAATLSIFSAAAPIEVVRLMGPLIGCLLVIAVAACVRLLTKSQGAALASAFALGLFVFSRMFSPDAAMGGGELGRIFTDALTRQWAGASVELAALFIVISAIAWHDTRRERGRLAWLDGCASVALVALTEPKLLPVAAVAGAAASSPLPALVSLSSGWVLLAVADLQFGAPADPAVLATFPIALALSIGAAFHIVMQLLNRVTRVRLEPIAVTLMASASLISMPHAVGGQYLEYDVSARKTLEIATAFPRQRWLIVAPVEALAQTFGRGGYEDLQQFVERYSSRADDPKLALPFSVEHVFVFVEKRPFVTFASEPIDVPFDVITDPSYRYYRAAAGRASVEYAALDLCERYQRAHKDVSIYYEDAVLKIYHFELPASR